MPKIAEDDIEQMAIKELQNLGYAYIHGAEIASDSETQERERAEL